mmetsp:Transcript_13412/g.20111  ORF Transcript_13412/g.20111 Transcript_13412/m.20111 type:complete len:398 (+) Transcript_13412:26-1219(+)
MFHPLIFIFFLLFGEAESFHTNWRFPITVISKCRYGYVTEQVPGSYSCKTERSTRNKMFLAMDSSDDNDQGMHLQNEFRALANGKSFITFESFMNWQEIQALFEDNLISMNDMQNLWQKYVGSMSNPINWSIFVKINQELDELLDEDISEEETDESDSPTEMDVWDPSIDSNTVFEKDFISYLHMFHSKYANVNGLLSYQNFKDWKDISDLMEEGNVDATCLKEIWSEALLYKYRSSNEEENESKTINEFALTRNQNIEKYMIDFDTFIRVNFRLEEVMEDIQKALEDLSDEDILGYYAKEFEALTGGESLLGFQSLFDWSVIQEVQESGQVSLQQLEMLWMALPKQPLGSFYRKKGFNNLQQSDGITLDAFVSFNNAMEDLMSANSNMKTLSETQQ